MIWDNDVRGHRFEEWTLIRDWTSIWVYHIYISVNTIYIPELVIPIMISVIDECLAANTEATGPMNYWWLRHHFENFIVPALIWSTFLEYQCHKWPRICSVGRYHNPVLSSFLTYHRTFNKDNTTGDTRGTGTIYARGVLEFIPQS